MDPYSFIGCDHWMSSVVSELTKLLQTQHLLISVFNLFRSNPLTSSNVEIVLVLVHNSKGEIRVNYNISAVYILFYLR